MTSQRYRKISTKASKKKETLKTRDEINKIEVKKVQRSHKMKDQFFEKRNVYDIEPTNNNKNKA